MTKLTDTLVERLRQFCAAPDRVSLNDLNGWDLLMLAEFVQQELDRLRHAAAEGQGKESANRPNGCACGPDVIVGNYKNQVEVPIPSHMPDYRDARVAAGLSGTVCIDRCILLEIESLWAFGIRTYGSCCGHNTSASMVNVHSDDDRKMLSLGYTRSPHVEGCWPNTFHLKTAGTTKKSCPQWRCTICGCLWREWPTSWSLWDGNQRPCGFCDNSPCFTAVINRETINAATPTEPTPPPVPRPFTMGPFIDDEVCDDIFPMPAGKIVPLPTPPPVSGWQPIETAPKGSWGTVRIITDHAYVEPPALWLFTEEGSQCCGYADYYYSEHGDGFDGRSHWVEAISGERITPTHWQPLPAAPSHLHEATK